MMAWRALIACLLLLMHIAQGFSVLQHRSSCNTPLPSFFRRPTALKATKNEEGNWQIPNDFKMFLTQCSIQSFIFLLRSMRDPQTVMWIENFTQPAIISKTISPNVTILVDSREEETATNATSKNAADENTTSDEPKASKLLQYHGLAALNTTLFPTWDAYFRVLLEQPAESLLIESQQAHIPSYDLDIDPASLCIRILSVREQIAREFVTDLQVIADMGGNTLESYWDSLKRLRETNETTDASVQRENLLFLELNADQDSDYAPSPLRKGNFDLLVLLATQESIHRVLNDNQEDAVTLKFLNEFYMDRLHYFRGPQRYGRADDFLEELLLSPAIITGKSLIDPTRIAELIMEEREDVANEWKDVAAESPKEHMEIQRLRLNRVMGVVETDEDDSFQ